MVSAGNLIVTQPVSQTICQKDQSGQFQSAQFTIEVVNPALALQWYRLDGENWVIIPGAIYPMYSAQAAGKYYCNVILSPTEQEGSDIVTLTINDAPGIMGFDIPMVCDSSELRVHVDPNNIVSNGSVITGYVWKLTGISGSITQPGTGSSISDFIISPAVAGQSGSVLTLSLTNGCGTTISDPPKPITVLDPTPLPTVISRDYCQGENAVILSINQDNEAVWYNAAIGGQIITNPADLIPKTSTPGTQKWWVSQKIVYPGGPTCESGRQEVTVKVFSLPAVPAPLPPFPGTTFNIDMCLNDPDIILNAQGSDLQWYDGVGRLPAAPQINTSIPKTLTYYVTQFDGTCESLKEGGKITILIKDRSVVDGIELAYNPELCPNNPMILNVTSRRPNPTFTWYDDDHKTLKIGSGPTFTTSVLKRDTAFYVTVQYPGECESLYPRAAVVNVRDNTLPKITAPPHLIINTDDGVCVATNVQTGVPFVSDNCTFEKDLLVFTNPIAPVTYSLGDTTLVWWVQDEAGNKDYALQTISVRDREKPRTTCPANIELDINENENSAVIDYILSYTDNCTPQSEVDTMLVRGRPSGSVFPLGETLVRYLISDKAGNIDTCQFKVIVKHPYREPVVTLRILPGSEICAGQEVVITPVISGGSGRFSYSWNPRRWTDAVMRDYPRVNTTYEVTIDDGVSTPQTKTIPITVLQPMPVTLTLEGKPMDQIFEGDEVLVTATYGFSSYKLLLNNEEIQVAGQNSKVGFQAELGTYFVRVFATDESGCVSQDQLEVVVDSEQLPNVFTPTRKSMNNQVFLEFLEKNVQSPEDFELQIFSRAGELLYKGNKGWDGYYKGKLMSQGTYLYVVRRKMYSGEHKGEYRTYKGVVTLKL